MSVNTVNISFREDLLEQIDNVAKLESRSRSELIREAARMYIEKKARWNSLFELGSSIQKNNTITEEDIFEEIKAVRNS